MIENTAAIVQSLDVSLPLRTNVSLLLWRLPTPVGAAAIMMIKLEAVFDGAVLLVVVVALERVV
jgi:hypothetical protein